MDKMCRLHERWNNIEVTRLYCDQAFEKIADINRNYTSQVKDSNAVVGNLNEIKSYLSRTEEALTNSQTMNIDLNSRIVEITSENTLLKSKVKSLNEKDDKISNLNVHQSEIEKIIQSQNSQITD